MLVRFAAALIVTMSGIRSAVAQLDLTPIHPVIGNVEAVGTGEFGESIVELRVPPTVSGNGPGAVRLQFFDVQGDPVGIEHWIAPEDIRLANGVGIYTSSFGSQTYQPVSGDSIFQLRVGGHIRDAGPLAYCFDVRLYGPSSNLLADLRPDADGLPGLGDNTDSVDRRFQIIRSRALLSSATIEFDPSTNQAHLRLPFTVPGVGPTSEIVGPLRTWDTLVTPQPGGGSSGNFYLSNPCDTDPLEVPSSAIELFDAAPNVQAWRPLQPTDVAAVSLLPGSSELVLTIDMKFSYLVRTLSPPSQGQWAIRIGANAPIRDTWGQRVRGNPVGLPAWVTCPGLPGTFTLSQPSPSTIDVDSRNPLRLAWATSSCASVGYHFDLSSDPDFSTIAIGGSSGGNTFYDLPPNFLQPGTKYYWRVFAINANGQTGAIQNGSWFATRVPGDVNGDGRVDSADLSVMLGNFGAFVP